MTLRQGYTSMESSMSKSAGIETWGKNRKALRGQKSKLEIIQGIGEKLNAKVLDIQALPIKDLKLILKYDPKTTPTLPSSRMKAPYIEQLQEAYPEVTAFDRLSVSGLKSLLKAIC